MMGLQARKWALMPIKTVKGTGTQHPHQNLDILCKVEIIAKITADWTAEDKDASRRHRLEIDTKTAVAEVEKVDT